jgi:hypothetical protein
MDTDAIFPPVVLRIVGVGDGGPWTMGYKVPAFAPVIVGGFANEVTPSTVRLFAVLLERYDAMFFLFSFVSLAPQRRMSGYGIFVDGLSVETTERYLFAHMSRIPGAEIDSVRVCRDPTTRNSLGYGYINATSEAARRAILAQIKRGLQVRNGRERLFGRAVTGHQNKDEPAREGRNLIIEKLPHTFATPEDIVAEFGDYSIDGIKIFGEAPRRMAYVLMISEEEAEKLLAEYKGPLVVKLHTKRASWK